jgi:hypothetical protein
MQAGWILSGNLFIHQKSGGHAPPPAPLFHGPCFGSFLGDWLWNVLIIGKPFKPTKLHFTMRSELTLFNLNLSLVNFTCSPPHQATPPATTPYAQNMLIDYT